jgi:hypothetical protein
MLRVPLKLENICLYGESHPLWEKKLYIPAKISLNSTNNLNYKETLLELIDGEKKKCTTDILKMVDTTTMVFF